MLPEGWIPHRRGDGETLGWLEFVGEDVVAHDLLGQRVSPPGLDWHEAEQLLEHRGIGYLAEPHTLSTPYGDFLTVRITEVTTDRVTVVVDERGSAGVIGSSPETSVLPFPVPVGLLRDYVRPRVDLGTWLDDDGNPIDYGSVYWGLDGEPAKDAYSVCRHPERFEPVVEVARALLDHLERAYDVVRTERGVDGQTCVRLTPASGDGAALMVLFPLTGLPGVEVTAGLRFRNSWPDCGCDACDDSVPDLLDEFERTVFAIVEGTMSEWRGGPEHDVPWTINVEFDDATVNSGLAAGWSSGEPEPLDLPLTPRRWGAWPLRG